MGKVLTIAACAVLAAGYIFTSCNTGCTDLRSAVPRADFYSMTTKKQISVDSLQIIGVGSPGDSLLYDGKTSLSTVYLPMPPLSNTVRWVLRFKYAEFERYGIADTLTLKFDRTPYFAGEECGAMYKYNITDVSYTTNVVDSVALTDSVVTNVDVSNLNIYFLTD